MGRPAVPGPGPAQLGDSVRNSLIAVLAIALSVFAAACGTGRIGPPAHPATTAVATVPDLIGKGLRTAEDDAQAAGFPSVITHDATGRGRHQFLARNWRVCFQTPGAGTRAGTGTGIGLGVVKLAETCPAIDQGTQTPAPISEGQPMPSLIGKSLNVAIAALPSSTSITTRDLSGRHRLIIIQSNWRVCSQNPGAGARFNGQPVTFGVVKFGEACS